MKRSAEKAKGYADYLASEVWAAKRLEVLARDKCCQAQGCEETCGLHVHHRRYPKTLGTEPTEWLVALCKPHHDALHALKKQARVGIARATAIFLDGVVDTRVEVRKPRAPRRRVKRKSGTNPRALGENPRARGDNPRARKGKK